MSIRLAFEEMISTHFNFSKYEVYKTQYQIFSCFYHQLLIITGILCNT